MTWRTWTVAAVMVMLTLPASARAASGNGADGVIVGGVVFYVVQPGDTLASVGARLGIEAATVADENGLTADARLRAGQRLRLDNRHIVPKGIGPDVLLVNIPQRMIFHRGIDGDVAAYPVAVGRGDWPTPTGSFYVIVKEAQPTWDVPVSIQEEGRRRGRILPKVVPPGPENPLGAFWIGLSISGLGVHGTNAPGSIYRAVTHGCVRLHPDDIGRLFDRIRVGGPGRIVYEPVLLAAQGDAVFLEVHRDVYRRRATDVRQIVRALAAANGLTDFIDWMIADAVIQARHGIARDVSTQEVAP